MSTTIQDSVAFPAKKSDEPEIEKICKKLEEEYGNDLFSYHLTDLWHKETDQATCDEEHQVWSRHQIFYYNASDKEREGWVKCDKFIQVYISAQGQCSNGTAYDVGQCIEETVKSYTVEARPIESEYEGEHSESWIGPKAKTAEALDVGERLVKLSPNLSQDQIEQLYRRMLAETL